MLHSSGGIEPELMLHSSGDIWPELMSCSSILVSDFGVY